jgi:signal transduction histidine kinase
VPQMATLVHNRRLLGQQIRLEAELRQRLQQLTALRRMESELGDQLEMGYVFEMALDAAMRLTNAHVGAIAMLEEASGGQELNVKAILGAASPTAPLDADYGAIRQALSTQRGVLLSPLEPERYHTLLPSAEAAVVMPLFTHEKSLGVLLLEARRAEHFNASTIEVMQLLTGRIAAALENARLYELSQRQLEELRELYAQVKKLENLKTDMIRIASHDLRNPLATMMGYVELLMFDQPLLQPDHVDFIQSIQRAGERMQKITSDILSLERIEETAREGSHQRMDLSALIEQAYHDVRDQAARKEQQFTLVLPSVPLYVQGDPIQLHEAAVNLINNAVKYTPVGGNVRVELKADRGIARFEVIDNGFGVPEDKQARLFEPFYRVKTQETRNIEGTGLGLHLVKNIVDRHLGKMIFSSTYGQGSTFGFALGIKDEIIS